jgi:hypothetical protein
MYNFELLIAALMLVSGICLMIWTTRHNRKLLHNQGSSVWKYFIGAVSFGVWIFLVSVGCILLIGSINGGSNWSAYETMEFIILALIGSLVAIVGALWQFFLVTKFRENLYQKLNHKK